MRKSSEQPMTGGRYGDAVPSTLIIAGAVEEAFHTYSKDGVLPIEHIDVILTAGRVPYDDADLQNAIAFVDNITGEPQGDTRKSFTLGEVLEIAHYLVPETSDGATIQIEKSQTYDHGPSIFGELFRAFKARFCRAPWKWFQKDENQEFASGMKPTTKLILIVVVLSFLMALVVGGTAVALDWTSAVNAEHRAMQQEMDMVMNAAEAFAVVQAAEREKQFQYATAYMLGEVIDNIGYATNLETQMRAAGNGVRIAGMMIDHIHVVKTLSEMLNSADGIGRTLDIMCTMNKAAGTPFDAGVIVNTLHQAGQLPDDHEIILASKATKTVMHPLKFRSQCLPTDTCMPSMDPSSPIGQAWQGNTGTYTRTGYAHTEQYGGYTYLPCLDAAILYQAKGKGFREIWKQETIDAINYINGVYDGTTEIMLQQVPGVALNKKKMEYACDYRGCSIDFAGAAAMRGYANGTSTAVGKDYRNTVQVIAAAYPLDGFNASLIFETDLDEVLNSLREPLRKSTSTINRVLNGTMEFLLGHQTDVNGTVGFELLTEARFTHQCANGVCQPCEALRRATAACDHGVDYLRDYRNTPVLAAYYCVDQMDLGIVVKVDQEEIRQTSVDSLVSYTNEQNKHSTNSMELMIGQINPANPNGPPQCLSQPRGISGYNIGNYGPMVDAVHKRSGDYRAVDHRGENTIAHYNYLESLKVGIVMKVDVQEVEKPLVTQLLIILFTAVGIAILGVSIVGISAQRMLKSIVDTWERSKKAVQEQKESFENLVSALYPKFASDKLLAGEHQIVLELSHATMFFSDICGFSTISNRLSAQELMGWIGYTFGVMDRIADFYKIYKIKTIGDAYFAIAGLPGIIPEGEVDNHTMRMVKFASACVQVFSGRYIHPDAGSCLKMIASHSAVVRKERKAVLNKGRRPSRGSAMTGTSGTTTSTDSNCDAQGTCHMRYGVASGPVTVGVLPGKCPAFDVWGKTVNLASRMESCGKSDGVLCSESVFRTVMADPANSYSFYDQVNVYAKGFGNVPAFFLRLAKEIPPKGLLVDLNLEPAVGDYLFEHEGLTVSGKAVIAHGSKKMSLSTSGGGNTSRGITQDFGPNARSVVVQTPPARSLVPGAVQHGSISDLHSGDGSVHDLSHVQNIPDTLSDGAANENTTLTNPPHTEVWK